MQHKDSHKDVNLMQHDADYEASSEPPPTHIDGIVSGKVPQRANDYDPDFNLRPIEDEADEVLPGLLAAFKELQMTRQMPEHTPLADSNGTVRFLHIPKTGTSFFNAVVKRACPRLPRNMMDRLLADGDFVHNKSVYLGKEYCDVSVVHNGHGALEEVNVPRAIGMFRSAENLTLSKYFFNKHGLDAGQKHDVEQSKTPVLAFTGYPQVISTETKILSGAAANAPIVPSQDDLKLALDRLVHMKFVGLTDQWVITLFLFSAMFGGRDLTPIDFGNVRNTRYDAKAYDDAVRQLRSRHSDPYDEEIYTAAEELFRKRAKQHFGKACAVVMRNKSNPLCVFMKVRGFITW